jgi:hypothetical protein
VAAVAVGAAAAAVIAGLSGPGADSGPSVAQAAVLGALPATAPAPAVDRVRSGVLRQSVDSVAFPDWRAGLHLAAVGQRVDQLAGRQAKTVFYVSPSAGQIGYTIVAGRPLALGHAAATLVRDSASFETMRLDGRAVVTWQRNGHTCILSSSGSGTSRLLALASSSVQDPGRYRAPGAA